MTVIPYTYFVNVSGHPNYVVFEYPNEFFRSRNPKYVRVYSINFITKVDTDAYGVRYLAECFLSPDHIAVHATFNQETDDTNHFICMTNEHFNPPKTFKIYSSRVFFTMWFMDVIAGESVPIDKDSRIIVQLEFEF